MGIESTLRGARTSLCWPGMNTPLKQFIATCDVCNAFQTKNRKETLLDHKILSRAWSKVASVIFGWNKRHYLVLVDYYSEWIGCDQIKSQTATEIIALMQKQFARWGIPDEIVTDSGKNYDSARSHNRGWRL